MTALMLPGDPDITGWFEDEAEIRDAWWQPGPGDVAADIGCHIGSYAVPALAAGAVVYAIDPSAAYTRTLRGICEANGLDTARLHVINEALAGEDGYPPEFRAALDAAPYPEHHAGAGASFTTLDRLAAREGIRRLDWVKIDVEGAELGVLRGGLETLRSLRPRLLIEDHTDVYPFVAEMRSAERCRELLEDAGYAVLEVPYSGHLTPDRAFWACTPARRGAA
jgi:FkbM family methyltransferase